MPKGKWAQGIKPRYMQWFVQDQLAICERPGGYGPDHRLVRRQEEVIWIRESDFAYLVSLMPTDENLETYDDCGMPWKHWPFAEDVELEVSLPTIYPELKKLLVEGKKILMHYEELGDRFAGFLGGYLRWSGMVDKTHEAITVTESILKRQMEPAGREIVHAAAALAGVEIDLTEIEQASPVTRKDSQKESETQSA